MLWVGLMGGASYVNVLYLLLEEDYLENNEKELAMNCVGVIFIDPGVMMASLSSLFISKVLFPK